MKLKRSKITILVIAVILIAALWATGLMGLWLKGLSYMAYNNKNYSNSQGHIVDGEFSISVNLKDLESNIGKELYNDGENKIYIYWMDNTGDVMSGGYRIGFRSSGQYSLDSATLVSGIHHEHSDNYYLESKSAIMTAKYKGNIYNSIESGTSALNYKDGDDFAFYIFPTEAYENGEVSLNEEGIVDITVTNLYKNIWTKYK